MLYDFICILLWEVKYKVNDVLIIGAGPAGLTAAIYAVRAGLSATVFEATVVGGQMTTTHLVENYPGFPNGISGFELAENMKKQAVRLGAQLISREIKSVQLTDTMKEIATRKETYQGKVVIVATGAAPRKLGIVNEDTFAGTGISYCATCDGGFFKDKVVAVIGGGDTALGDASYLSRMAKKVYIIHRRDEFRAANTVRENALSASNVEPIYDSVVESFIGDQNLQGAMIRNLKTGEENQFDFDGAFIAVGNTPRSDLFQNILTLDKGYIAVNDHCETNVAGVYAIGDVRANALRQIITACADGAIAIESAHQYI